MNPPPPNQIGEPDLHDIIQLKVLLEASGTPSLDETG